VDKRGLLGGGVLLNVLFPIWFFFLVPTWLWLILLPANFAIDSLVLWLAGKWQKVEDLKALWKKSILWVWIIGFASDFVGALASFGFMWLWDVVLDSFVTLHINWILEQTLTGIPGVIVAGLLIYFLNKAFSFRKAGHEKDRIERICKALAIATAPYTMLIPLYWW